MPVPDYQSLMAPILSAIADGGDHSLAELRETVASRLTLTEDDLQAKIPSGHRCSPTGCTGPSPTCTRQACLAAPSAAWSA